MMRTAWRATRPSQYDDVEWLGDLSCEFLEEMALQLGLKRGHARKFAAFCTDRHVARMVTTGMGLEHAPLLPLPPPQPSLPPPTEQQPVGRLDEVLLAALASPAPSRPSESAAAAEETRTPTTALPVLSPAATMPGSSPTSTLPAEGRLASEAEGAGQGAAEAVGHDSAQVKVEEVEVEVEAEAEAPAVQEQEVGAAPEMAGVPDGEGAAQIVHAASIFDLNESDDDE